MPATVTAPSVMTAIASVTAQVPVGEPTQGSMPARLQPRMKKKIVQRIGV